MACRERLLITLKAIQGRRGRAQRREHPRIVLSLTPPVIVNRGLKMPEARLIPRGVQENKIQEIKIQAKLVKIKVPRVARRGLKMEILRTRVEAKVKTASRSRMVRG
jgi:hypothetical protein